MKRALTLRIPFESVPPWLYLGVRGQSDKIYFGVTTGERDANVVRLLGSFGVPSEALGYLVDARLDFDSLSVVVTFVDMDGRCGWMPYCSPTMYPLSVTLEELRDRVRLVLNQQPTVVTRRLW